MERSTGPPPGRIRVPSGGGGPGSPAPPRPVPRELRGSDQLTRRPALGRGVGLLLAHVGQRDAAVAVLPAARGLRADHPAVLLARVVRLICGEGRAPAAQERETHTRAQGCSLGGGGRLRGLLAVSTPRPRAGPPSTRPWYWPQPPPWPGLICSLLPKPAPSGSSGAHPGGRGRESCPAPPPPTGAGYQERNKEAKGLCSPQDALRPEPHASPLSQLRYFKGELSDHCQPPLVSRSFRPIQSVEL